MNPSSPTGQPTSRPSSRPTFIIKVTVAATQVILGVTANSQQFQDAFIAALAPLLPKYSTVIITSVLLYYDDGTTTSSRRVLLKSVVGVQVAYSVTTTAAATTPASIVASLATPNAITSLSTALAATYPNAFVQAPLISTSGIHLSTIYPHPLAHTLHYPSSTVCQSQLTFSTYHHQSTTIQVCHQCSLPVPPLPWRLPPQPWWLLVSWELC